MKKIIGLLIVLLFTLSCKKHEDTFEFRISGTIVGNESGELYIGESSRVGDEIPIPYNNYKFEYKGESPNLYSSQILLDINGEKGVLPIVIEPGEMIFELNYDSLVEKSLVHAGYYNKAYRKARQEYISNFATADYNSQIIKDKIIQWFKNNNENYLTIDFLSGWESRGDFLPLDILGELIHSIEDKNLIKSREYIELYSIWLSKTDSINRIGKKATNFRLPDIDNILISFNSVANKKLTYVENSGSWCGNSTRRSRELIPIYEKYKGNGFEVITIVCESKLDRWEKWIQEEVFPWVCLIELEDEIAEHGIKYSSLLFKNSSNPNYLVDSNGYVIATSLSTNELKEILLKTFEPEVYQKDNENIMEENVP